MNIAISKGQKTNKKLLIAIAAMLVTVMGLIIHFAMPKAEPEPEPDPETAIQTSGRIEIPGYSEELAEYNEANGYTTDTALITIEASLRRAPKYEEQIYADYDNEQVRFRVHYKNHSGETKQNIVLRAILPVAIEYEKGSTTIFNTNHPDGVLLSDNLFTDSGMNIGAYGNGADAWIYFNATVNKDEVNDGNTIFRNIIQVYDGVATYENKADVLVSKSPETRLTSYLSGYSGSDWKNELNCDARDEFTVYMLVDNAADTVLGNPILKASLPEGFEYVDGSAEVSYMDGVKGKVTESISDSIIEDGAQFKGVGANSNILISYKVRISEGIEPGSKHTITSVADIGEQSLHDNVYIYIND